MLKDFLIPIPNTKNFAKEQQDSIKVTTEEFITEPIEEPFHEPIAETRIVVENETRKEQAKEGDIQIISSVSLANEVQIIPPTKTYHANKLSSLAPKVNTRAAKSFAETPISSRINILRSRKKTNQHDLQAAEDPITTNVVAEVPNAIKSVSKITKPLIKKPTNVKTNSRDLNLSLTEPDINLVELTTAAQQNVIRIFSRNVDAQVSTKKQTTLETPSVAFTQRGLVKSFPEKAIVQSDISVFVPPVRLDVPTMKNGRYFTFTEELARAADYRKILSVMYEVPGIYTFYRDRPTPNIDVMHSLNLLKSPRATSSSHHTLIKSPRKPTKKGLHQGLTAQRKQIFPFQGSGSKRFTNSTVKFTFARWENQLLIKHRRLYLRTTHSRTSTRNKWSLAYLWNTIIHLVRHHYLRMGNAPIATNWLTIWKTTKALSNWRSINNVAKTD